MISLVINSRNPNQEYIDQLFETSKVFDEVIFYIDGVDASKEIPVSVPSYVTVIGDGLFRTVCEGFNYAVHQSRHEYICAFCDDDYFIQPALSDLKTRIDRGEYDCADVIHFPVALESGLWGANQNINIESLEASNMIPCGSFFKRNLFYDLSGFQVESCSDWDFWLRALRAGYVFKYYENPVYYFRVRSDSLTRRLNAQYGPSEIRQQVLDNSRKSIHHSCVRAYL